MEDQIAKYSKEISDAENENKSMSAENTKLKKEIEKNASHRRGSTNNGGEIIRDPNGNQEDSENADDVERRWEEIISELEQRIEVGADVSGIFYFAKTAARNSTFSSIYLCLNYCFFAGNIYEI